MKTNRLTTSVTAVPSSDHQRMYSSVPLGKKSRTSAKALGRKTSSDIQIRSVSAMEGHSRKSDALAHAKSGRAGDVSPPVTSPEDLRPPVAESRPGGRQKTRHGAPTAAP